MGPQLAVVLVHHRSDRIGAGVGTDDAGDEPGSEASAEPEVLAVLRAVEAREVDDAGVADGLGHLYAMDGQPCGDVTAATGGRDHELSIEHGPVLQLDAGDDRRTRLGMVGPHAGDADPEPHGDVGLGDDAPTQHPLEGGPAAGQEVQVVLRRERRTSGVAHRQGEAGTHGHGVHPRVAERLEHIGEAVSQDRAGETKEGMRVLHLRCPTPVPLEGAFDVGRHRRVVPFDDGDAVA